MVKLEHKPLYASKRLNFKWCDTAKPSLGKLKELDEFQLHAYESSSINKERMKLYHDIKIKKKVFEPGDLVFLYSSRHCLFPGKVKSRW